MPIPRTSARPSPSDDSRKPDMFGGSEPSQYDVHFRLFGTPVRVNPFFWLVTLALGLDTSGGGSEIQGAIIWVAAVFISIMWHEYGHVFAARACHWGVDEVVLHSFGGYAALRPPHGPRSAINEIFVYLAGPTAGFVLYGAIQLMLKYSPEVLLEMGALGIRFWSYLVFINLYWGLFNLLPIFPLDGGLAVRAALTSMLRGGGALAAMISIVLAAVTAIYMFQQGSVFLGIMLLMMGFMNLQLLQRS